MHEINNSLKWMRVLDSCTEFECIYTEHSKVCMKMGRYLVMHFKSISMNDILNCNKENTTAKHIF